jgi:2Fe-2S ferredoxin
MGLVLEARSQDPVMAAAQARGYYWPTTCGGEGRCSTCALTVVSGAENLTDMGRSERKTIEAELGPSALAKGVRLACQARVMGDVEVLKPGVRRDWHANTTPITAARPRTLESQNLEP